MAIAVIAGEVSGDQLGALILAEFKKIVPLSDILIVGGHRMREVDGCTSVINAEDLSVVGITEVAARYFELRTRLKNLAHTLATSNVDLLVTIDFPGFNLRLARKLAKQGIRTLHIVSPQVWAWREGRVEEIRRHVDELVVLFPFEVEWYRTRGMSVHYFGHPLLDQIAYGHEGNRERVQNEFGEETRTILSWMPGSRENEVRRHLPIMLEAAQKLGGFRYRHLFSRVEGVNPALYPASSIPGVEYYSGPTELLLEAASIGILKSGTITLEALMYNLPMIVVYKVSRITYFIASRLAKIKLIAMPNVLAGREVVSELVQHECTSDSIVSAVEALMAPKQRTRVTQSLKSLSSEFETGGSAHQIAHFIWRQWMIATDPSERIEGVPSNG